MEGAELPTAPDTRRTPHAAFDNAQSVAVPVGTCSAAQYALLAGFGQYVLGHPDYEDLIARLTAAGIFGPAETAEPEADTDGDDTAE